MQFGGKDTQVFLSFLVTLYCSRTQANDVAEESLLVIRGLGVQTSTSSSMYWSSAATRFIPTTQIQDIVIHEAFKGFEVRFYLAIIVEGESGVVVVFPVNPLLSTYLEGRLIWNRIFCPNAHSLKRSGEALVSAFTNPRPFLCQDEKSYPARRVPSNHLQTVN